MTVVFPKIRMHRPREYRRDVAQRSGTKGADFCNFPSLPRRAVIGRSTPKTRRSYSKNCARKCTKNRHPKVPKLLIYNKKLLAEWTGLEPATPGVTGLCSERAFMRVCGQSAFQKQCNSVQIRRGLRRFHSKREMPSNTGVGCWCSEQENMRGPARCRFQPSARSCPNTLFRAVSCNSDRYQFQKVERPRREIKARSKHAPCFPGSQNLAVRSATV